MTIDSSAETRQTVTPVTTPKERRNPERLLLEQRLRVYEAWVTSLDERVGNGDLTEEQRRRMLSVALIRRDMRTDVARRKIEIEPMTGFHRQELIRPRLAAMIKKGQPFGLLLTDLDHFRDVNKKYGQPTGDELIMQAALRISEQLREEGESSGREPDVPFRNGGDESAIILPGLSTPEGLQVVAGRLRQSIESTPFTLPFNQGRLPITVSIGGAVWHSGDAETFMNEAGQGLVQAKQVRNTVTIK